MKEKIKYAHADGDLFEFPEVSSELVVTNKRKLCRRVCTLEGVTGYITSMIERRSVENFVIAAFDQRCNPICYSIIGIGIEIRAQFSICELLRVALLSNASGIIVYHNHTHADLFPLLEPSEADDKVTQFIYDRLYDIGVLLIDSIIVGNGKEPYSYRKAKRGPYKQKEENNEKEKKTE